MEHRGTILNTHALRVGDRVVLLSRGAPDPRRVWALRGIDQCSEPWTGLAPPLGLRIARHLTGARELGR